MIRYDCNLLDCVCGGNAKYEYRIPLHYVHCEKKRCPMRTKGIHDTEGVFDPVARDLAFAEWNRMMIAEHKQRREAHNGENGQLHQAGQRIKD